MADRGGLDPRTDRPLVGKRVLVTRNREQAGKLSRLLAEAGAEPVELPTIRIAEPESWEDLDRALHQLDGYGWVVFTSANGVRGFFSRLGALGKDARALQGVKIAVIGPASADALREAGMRAELIPDEYVAEALAGELVRQDVGGKRILVARPAEGREVLVDLLRAQGAEVDEPVVYRTLPAQDAGQRVAQLMNEQGLDVATFASSSSVRNLMALLGAETATRLGRVTIACIGPVTAETAREFGLRVDVVAQEYTISGLVRALENYYRDGAVSPSGEEA